MRPTSRNSEQVRQGGKFVTFGTLKPQGRAAGAQHQVTERCHFQPRGDWLGNLLQLAETFEAAHEVPQVAIFHYFGL
jgi:hypothetical protein